MSTPLKGPLQASPAQLTPLNAKLCTVSHVSTFFLFAQCSACTVDMKLKGVCKNEIR